jgi:hypothetical protein
MCIVILDSTGSLKMPVETGSPSRITKRGKPTLIESIFIEVI